MNRSLLRLAALLFIATCFTHALHTTAEAQRFRVLVSTDTRQLRSVVLDVTGYATSPNGPEHLLRREALDDARHRALELARKDLLAKIETRNLNLHLAFLGEPEVAPLDQIRGGKDEPATANITRTAVFIHSAEKVELTETGERSGNNYSLSVRAEVVYVLQPTGEKQDRLRKPSALPMTPPGQSPSRLEGEAGRQVREEAEESMARQLLEALTKGGNGTGTGGQLAPFD